MWRIPQAATAAAHPRWVPSRRFRQPPPPWPTFGNGGAGGAAGFGRAGGFTRGGGAGHLGTHARPCVGTEGRPGWPPGSALSCGPQARSRGGSTEEDSPRAPSYRALFRQSSSRRPPSARKRKTRGLTPSTATRRGRTSPKFGQGSLRRTRDESSQRRLGPSSVRPPSSTAWRETCSVGLWAPPG